MSKKKVIIIDDDIDFVRVTKSILTSAGYRVNYCLEPQSALDKIKKFNPDLIILDIMMHISAAGFHLVHEIRNDPGCARIPVLMVTAIHHSLPFRFSPETDGEHLPVQKLLDKPVATFDLLKEVAILVGNGE